MVIVPIYYGYIILSVGIQICNNIYEYGVI